MVLELVGPSRPVIRLQTELCLKGHLMARPDGLSTAPRTEAPMDHQDIARAHLRADGFLALLAGTVTRCALGLGCVESGYRIALSEPGLSL
jgi:hypothetical protein